MEWSYLHRACFLQQISLYVHLSNSVSKCKCILLGVLRLNRIHVFHEYQGLNSSIAREQISEHIISNDIEPDGPHPLYGPHITDMTLADRITKSSHLSIQSLFHVWHERERAAAATQHAYQ